MGFLDGQNLALGDCTAERCQGSSTKGVRSNIYASVLVREMVVDSGRNSLPDDSVSCKLNRNITIADRVRWVADRYQAKAKPRHLCVLSGQNPQEGKQAPTQDYQNKLQP